MNTKNIFYTFPGTRKNVYDSILLLLRGASKINYDVRLIDRALPYGMEFLGCLVVVVALFKIAPKNGVGKSSFQINCS